MIKILNQKSGVEISKYIYGHFAEHLGRCIYEGLYVGAESEIPNKNGMRLDVIEALKAIEIPVLRWPGGCFADEYHWKDGIGPKAERKKMVNTHWGGLTENNHFGTHEFFELAEQLNCEVYVNGNVGSGTVQEMQEWVEYMTMAGESPMAELRRKNGRETPWKVKFFGVGNESWGCGGNMRPSYYADLYRQYQTYVRQYGAEEIYKIACGPNVDDYQWMEEVLRISGPYMDGISLHHYALTGAWEDKGPALGFTEAHWWSLLESAKKMDKLITKHTTIMDKYDPDRRIGLIVDEWGSWLAPEAGTNPGFLYQQNTIRDAMVAALTLNIFHKHAERVQMANIAQTVNVLQAMLLTEGDKLVKTPSYYVFELYKVHQGAQRLDCYGQTPEHVSYTVSRKKSIVSLSICNYSLTKTTAVKFELETPIKEVCSSRFIQGMTMDSHNDFAHPDTIVLQDFTEYNSQNQHLELSLSPKSILTIQLELSE
ncbi:alpha-N-arabinofuranosidase [Enterococcus sp. LJL128]|uniref:alpha-N-arabinofuranosidase n=1 Tax=Enterococcus sp. LJL51 TaxID=3416656 RepID=UPI003CEC5529